MEINSSAAAEPRMMPIALRYGLITGALVVVYSLILQLTNLYLSNGLPSVKYIFLIGAIIIAYREFKSQNQGFMSYVQGLGLGTLLSVIAGLIGGLFDYIYIKFVDTTIIDQMIELERQELEKGNISEEKIEQAIEMSSSLTTPEILLVIITVGFIFTGFLISLVVAAAMRNPRPEFD